MSYLALEALQAERRIKLSQLAAESKDGPWFPIHKAPFLAFLAVAAKHWHWLKPGSIDDTLEGPVTGEYLLLQLKKMRLKPDTAVSHHIHTKRQWKKISDTPIGSIFNRDKLRRERGFL